MKVYLQYPWKFPDSPYYKYLIENPPKDFEYVVSKKQKGVMTNQKAFLFSNYLKKNIRHWTNKLKLKIPNAHLSPAGDYDLIHCAHCLSKNLDKPWVADIEMMGSLAISGRETSTGNRKIKEILLRENCKKILPWTKHVENLLLKDFPDIKSKVELVYPAVPEQKAKRKSHKKIKILYVSRYFWIKGGLIALEILSELKEKFGDKIEIIFIAEVDENLKKKFPLIKIQGLVSQKKMFEIYRETDIMFYPSLGDTFGFALLEAMSFGIPTVALNTNKTQTRKEIISEGKTGFLIDVEEKIKDASDFEKLNYSIRKQEKDEVVRKMSRLIEDRKLREKISKNCLKEIKEGKFSIKERNKKLNKIYMDALK